MTRRINTLNRSRLLDKLAAPVSIRRWALSLTGCLIPAAFNPSLIAADPSPEHLYAIKQLEARKAFQIDAARNATFFHDFTFTDRIEESNIGFRNRVVDDAAISYKAAHYDHGNGVAAADVNGDGLEDLYFTTQLGVSQLWRNLGNGKFVDSTREAGVGLPDHVAVGASFADIDNDGDPDLFVTTVRRGNRLFENIGDGKFQDISAVAGVNYVGHSSGSVFFDYNNDGRLDLLVVNVGAYTTAQQGRGGFYRAYPDAFSGHLFPERTEASILYKNVGGNKFVDVSKETGLNDMAWTGDAAVTDLNRDGFLDVYFVNMQGDDHYYENQSGTRFVEKTAEYFPKTPWGAMGVKFFDYNQDGRFDLYVTDMHSDMTQGQTMDALRFSPKAEKAKSEAYCAIQWTKEYLQGASNNIFGNAFYTNLGDGQFKEISNPVGVETYWPWGFSTGDLNADGFEDLFVASGMGYPFRYGINSILLNDAGKRFQDSEFLVGVEPRGDGRTERVWFTLDCDGIHKQHPECAQKTGPNAVLGTLSTRSSLFVDLDNDGDLDIVTNEFNDRPQLLFSNLAERKHVSFLKLKLVGTTSNRDGLGARVTIRVGDRSLHQQHDGKSGYLSQSAIPLYFGLGDAKTVDALEILWPSGAKQTVKGPQQINRIITIHEEQ